MGHCAAEGFMSEVSSCSDFTLQCLLKQEKHEPSIDTPHRRSQNCVCVSVCVKQSHKERTRERPSHTWLEVATALSLERCVMKGEELTRENRGAPAHGASRARQGGCRSRAGGPLPASLETLTSLTASFVTVGENRLCNLLDELGFLF